MISMDFKFQMFPNLFLNNLDYDIQFSSQDPQYTRKKIQAAIVSKLTCELMTVRHVWENKFQSNRVQGPAEPGKGGHSVLNWS